MKAKPRVMHQTTVRFGTELWEEIGEAADRAGTSVAQYVREAAIMRLARSWPATPAEEASLERSARARAITPDAATSSVAVMAERRLAKSRA